LQSFERSPHDISEEIDVILKQQDNAIRAAKLYGKVESRETQDWFDFLKVKYETMLN
tara:strand:+ start:61 stop:231 length:171 start_codon:yes stop_codon:yes gene_type:complete